MKCIWEFLEILLFQNNMFFFFNFLKWANYLSRANSWQQQKHNQSLGKTVVNDEDPGKGSWSTETTSLQNDVSNPHLQLPTPTHNPRTQDSSKSQLNISKKQQECRLLVGRAPHPASQREGRGQKGGVLSPPLGCSYLGMFQHEKGSAAQSQTLETFHWSHGAPQGCQGEGTLSGYPDTERQIFPLEKPMCSQMLWCAPCCVAEESCNVWMKG